MTKQFLSILLSLALLLTCVSGLTLAVGADDVSEEDVSLILSFDNGQISLINGKNGQFDEKNTFSNESVKTKFIAQANEDLLYADSFRQEDFADGTPGYVIDGKWAYPVVPQGIWSRFRLDTASAAASAWAGKDEFLVTILCYVPDVVTTRNENTRLNFVQEGKSGGNNQKIFRAGVDNRDFSFMPSGHWGTLSFVMSNYDNWADQAKGSWLFGCYGSNDAGIAADNWNGSYFFINRISIMPVEYANAAPAATDYDYVDFTGYVPNPFYPEYSAVTAQGVKFWNSEYSSGKGGALKENGFETKGGVFYFTTEKALGKQYVLVKVEADKAIGKVGGNVQRTADTWSNWPTWTIDDNVAFVKLTDAAFSNGANGGSFRFSGGDMKGVPIKRVEIHPYETEAELNAAYDALASGMTEYRHKNGVNAIQLINASFEGALGGTDIKGARLTTKDGTFVYGVNSDSNIFIGLGDPQGILNSSTSVTYEYDIYFDCAKNGNSRVFPGYGTTSEWVHVNGDGDNDNMFCAYGRVGKHSVGDTPKNGEWLTIAVKNDAYSPTQTNNGMITRLGFWVEGGCAIYVRGIRAYDSNDSTKKLEVKFLATPSSADVTALQNAVNAAKTEQGAFNSTSWIPYAKAVSKAIPLVDNGTATQEQIDAALAALNAAAANLTIDVNGATTIAHNSYVGINGCRDEGNNIGDAGDGAYVEYKINVKNAGYYTASVNASTANDNKYELLTDGESGRKGFKTIYAYTPIVKDGWDNYHDNEMNRPFYLEAGVQLIRLTIVNGGSNFKSFTLTPTDDTVDYITVESTPIELPAKEIHVLSGGNAETDWQRFEGDLNNTGHNNGGRYVEYKINVAAAGVYNIDLYLGSPGDTSKVQLRDENDSVYGEVTVIKGNWDDWHSHSINDVMLKKGVQVLRVYFVNGNCNYQKMTISKSNDFSNIAYLYGNSLTLDGKIGVNFYMNLPASVTGDADAYVTLNDGDPILVSGITHGELEPGDGKDLYKVTGKVAAKEMQDDVTLRLYNGAGEQQFFAVLSAGEVSDVVNSYTYTVNTYLENNTVSNLDDLVAAMADYGAYAQTYFQYGTPGTPGNVSDVTADTVSAHAPVVASGAEIAAGIIYKGSSLILESETTLRFYFQVSGDASGYGFDGQAHGYYYKEITNIAAKDLDEKYSVDVAGVTVEESALTYAYKVLSNDGNSDELKNLVRALVKYNAAANAYFTQTP